MTEPPLTNSDRFILALVGIIAGGITTYCNFYVGFVMTGLFCFMAGYYTGQKKEVIKILK